MTRNGSATAGIPEGINENLTSEAKVSTLSVGGFGVKRYALWSRSRKIGFFLTNRKRETCEFDSRSIHVQQSLSMLELLMAVPLNYEMLEDVSYQYQERVASTSHARSVSQ